MRIETPRLFLREMAPEDYDALYAVLADSDIMRHYPYTFDEARVRRWIDKNMERCRVFGFGLWVVCLKATGGMIGDCGLTMQNINGTILPELGYHIAKAHQRQGYGTEAARAVHANGMRLLGAFTDGEGERSVVYGIGRTEWEIQNKRDGCAR